MGVGLSGGYGEKRGQSREQFQYDTPGTFAREQAYNWWQNPNTMPGFFRGTEGGLGTATLPDLSTMESIVGDLRGMGTGLTPTEERGVAEFRNATNLGNLQRAQAANFGMTAVPNIRNALASSGRGRSGAEAEAISRAGVEATVPLTQLANQRQAELGKLISGMGTSAADRFLRALLGGGELSLRGELGSAEQANRLKLQQLANRQDMFGQLLNFLRPLQIGGTKKTKGSEWDVQGKASYGITGGGGGGGGTSDILRGVY